MKHWIKIARWIITSWPLKYGFFRLRTEAHEEGYAKGYENGRLATLDYIRRKSSAQVAKAGARRR